MREIQNPWADVTHNEKLYHKIGPRKINDVHNAYVEGWIDEEQMENDLEKIMIKNNR